jgi:hypothetical protein
VYTRGFVKPAAGCNLPELRCEYVYATVEAKGVLRAFTHGRTRTEWDYAVAGHLERLTRVTLTNDPRAWDRDLELVPGTTLVGTAGAAITGWVGFFGPLWSALLGAALGLAIPRLSMEKHDRKRIDLAAGALTGAAIVLTIWVSALVFLIWRWQKFRGHPDQPKLYLVLPCLALSHFLIVFAVCRGLTEWITAGG